MALILRTWPEYSKDLKRAGVRWRLDKNSKSPFIYVRDQKASKITSCKPFSEIICLANPAKPLD